MNVDKNSITVRAWLGFGQNRPAEAGKSPLRGPEGAAPQEWREALEVADRHGLTLVLRGRMRDAMPEWARARVDRDFANNAERLRRIHDLYRSMGEWLAGIEFVALKGIAQPLGVPPDNRVQYDIDLFCPRESVERARDALVAQGYESLPGMEEFPTDHLPALIRKTGWEWRGDFFDPEIPTPIELHFRFWDESTERLAAPGVEEFWERRVPREIEGIRMMTLADVDAAGYAALHLLRHLLRGNVRELHVYELAHFLNARAGDAPFWAKWRALHGPALRRLEAVSFRLAQARFGCAVAPEVEQEIAELPESTLDWFERERVDKDEVWLHWSLLEKASDRWTVLRRRLLPGRLPGPVDSIYIPDDEMTFARRLRKRARYGAFVASRAAHHLTALPGVLAAGANLGRSYWTFLGAAALYNLGMFIFVLLYNLRLIDLGFRENFLGAVSGASTAGCILGTLPAAMVARRFGLRNTVLGCFGLTAAATAARALATAPGPILALALVNGVGFSVWAVTISPLIAGCVRESRRPAAFSIFFGSMIALGTVGGWIGGRLPGWLHGKTEALLAGAVLAALSILPAWRLQKDRSLQNHRSLTVATRNPSRDRKGAVLLPHFLLRFLIPFAIWRLATGSFNPFFNAYFARLHFPVEKIGSLFSGAQLLEAVTVLAAPLLIRRIGLAGAIVWMMAATALGLAGLAAQPPAAAAALAYAGYMAFQWMSEPGLNTLLMNQVEERDRSRASSVMYLVAFSADAAAALAAGAMVARNGYGPVLAGAAALACTAAALFQYLLKRESTRRSSEIPAADIAPG